MLVRPSYVGKSTAGLATATLVAAAAVGSVALAASAPATADTPQCQLGNSVQHVISIVFDNVHFFRDNPKRPVRPRADAAPAELPEVERHGVLQYAHAADRAHGRGQPGDLHRPVRRPARATGQQLL